MEAITPLDLSEIQAHLQDCLQQELGEQVHCEVNCWIQKDTVLVFIQSLEQKINLDKTILDTISDCVSQVVAFSPYCLKVYWLWDGEVYSLNLNDALLVPFSSPLLSSQQIIQQVNFQGITRRLKKRQYRKSISKVLALGIGISIGLGLLYILTRPCVVGACPQLKQAQTDAEETLNKIDGVVSEAEILAAKEQLSHSIELLKPIPPWSVRYGTAIAAISDYERQLLSLESLMIVTQQANQTQQSVKTASQTVTEWQSSKTKLEEAMTRLPSADLPKAIEVSVDLKKRQYERTLADIEALIQLEKGATTQLEEGEEVGKLALARQKTAQSLENWQSVEDTWQSAINKLQTIPVNTTSHNQARQLLQEYNYQLVKAQGIRQRVEQSFNLLTTAQNQAKKAQNWQDKKEWSKAVEQWGNALTNLQQIPKSSVYAQQASPLISSYQLATNQAKIELNKALARQELTQYLESLCQRPETICYFTVQNNLIKVSLTEDYHQQLLATAAQAQQDNDQQARLHLENHLYRLENGLRSLSLKARLTIELYRADEQLMMTFQPN